MRNETHEARQRIKDAARSTQILPQGMHRRIQTRASDRGAECKARVVKYLRVKDCKFSELEDGDKFLFNKHISIKMQPTASPINACSFHLGMPMNVSGETVVTKIELVS